jgi:hypothetical protein
MSELGKRLGTGLVILSGFVVCNPAMVRAQTVPKPSLAIPSPLASSPTVAEQNALQNLTSAQQENIQTYIRPQLLQAIENNTAATGTFRSWQSILANPGGGATAHINSSAQGVTVQFINSAGSQFTVTPTFREYHPAGSNTASVTAGASRAGSLLRPTCCHPIPPAPQDLDGDGLTDSQSDGEGGLEYALAMEFMPEYFISTGEQQQFASYGNYVPWTVTGLLGTNPPTSRIHVTPLGLGTDQNGNQVYAIRADFLSLWNADGGLVGGGAACFYSYFGLDNVIQQVSGHYLDAERSVMLLAAPPVNGGVNPDATAYRLYSIYTAAHEGTFFDQSEYLDFSNPVAAGNHILLTQSVSKHSTYAFNPDFYPITPAWFIASTNASIEAAYLDGDIDDATYLALLAAANDTFYGCLVERFGNQGGQIPSQATNVGEVDHPIFLQGYIQDNSSAALNLASKLTNPVF